MVSSVETLILVSIFILLVSLVNKPDNFFNLIINIFIIPLSYLVNQEHIVYADESLSPGNLIPFFCFFIASIVSLFKILIYLNNKFIGEKHDKSII